MVPILSTEALGGFRISVAWVRFRLYMLGYHYGFCSSVGGKTRRYAFDWKKRGGEGAMGWDDGEGGRSRFEVQYVAGKLNHTKSGVVFIYSHQVDKQIADVVASLLLAALQVGPSREE